MSCLKERKKKLLVLESESCSAVTKHEGLWDSLAVGPLLLLKFEGLCLKQALLFGFCMLRVWNGIPVLVQSLLFLLTLPLLLPQGSFCHYHPGEEVMWSCFCCHHLVAMLNRIAWVLGHSCSRSVWRCHLNRWALASGGSRTGSSWSLSLHARSALAAVSEEG